MVNTTTRCLNGWFHVSPDNCAALVCTCTVGVVQQQQGVVQQQQGLVMPDLLYVDCTGGGGGKDGNLAVC